MDSLTKGWEVSPLLPLTIRDFPHSCRGRGTDRFHVNSIADKSEYIEEGFNRAHSLGVLSIMVGKA